MFELIVRGAPSAEAAVKVAQGRAGFGMLFQSARRAGRSVRLIQQMGAAPDHPQRPDFARSRYLKGALLYVE